MTWGWVGGGGGQCILSIFVLTFVEIVKRGGKVKRHPDRPSLVND